jgi:hypothetical protein
MRQLLPHLDSARDLCTTVLSQVEQMSRPPGASGGKQQK